MQVKVNLEPLRGLYFPYGAIALNLEYFTNTQLTNTYTFFNLQSLEQQSPIGVHLNANWAMSKSNRTQLVDYTTDLAKTDTDWNKCLINHIILPLFIKLFEYLKQNVDLYNLNRDFFMRKYLNLLPHKDPADNLKPYFADFLSTFYSTIYPMDLIPTVNYQSDSLSWHKPSEIYFTTGLDRFLNEYFTTEEAAFDCIKEIYLLLQNASLKLCRHNQVAGLFTRFSGIQLNHLTAIVVINKLKQMYWSLNGQSIDKTIVKNSKNLNCLLDFVRQYTKNNLNLLENCPLLLRQDEKLVAFSRINKVIYYDNPRIFKNHEYLFLHESQLTFFKDNELFFRPISTYDLAYLLPVLLDSNKYQTFNKSKCVEFDNDKIDTMMIIWKILYLTEHSKSNFECLKNWTLIPVSYSAPFDNTTNKTYLSSIGNADAILYPAENNRLFNLLKSINVPIFDPNISRLVNEIFGPILIKITKNEDLLTFLDSQKSNYTQLFSQQVDRQYFLDYLVDCCFLEGKKVIKFRLENEASMDKATIQSIVKGLPIHSDIFGFVSDLTQLTIYRLDLVETPKSFREKITESEYSHEKEDFIDFCNQTRIKIVDDRPRMKHFHTYLDIRPITFNQLYELFFKWVTGKPKEHHKILIDHVSIITHRSIQQTDRLWDVLSNLAFININGSYYRANECYDYDNELFAFAFADHLFPIRYDDSELRKDQLVKLGMKINLNAHDIVKVVDLLSNEKNQLSLGLYEFYVESIVKEIVRLNDKYVFDSIKNVKFIPSAFCQSDEMNDLLKEIYDPIETEPYICLNNSAFNGQRQFCWIEKNILPTYCRYLFPKSIMKQFNIDWDVDGKTIVKNFAKMAEMLKAHNRLGRLLTSEYRQGLIELFANYYAKLENLIQSGEREIKSLRDKDIVLIRCKSKTQFNLVPVNHVFLNVDRADQVEHFIYKIPINFQNNWKLFKYFGANDEINFDTCQQILTFYYRLNEPLNSGQYEDVLTTIKILLFNNLLDKSETTTNELYFPNALHQMRPLNELFYLDNVYFAKMLEQSTQIKEICLFNETDLIPVIENANDISYLDYLEYDDDDEPKNQTSDFVKDIIFNNISWKKIFEFSIQQKVPCIKPKPLSEVIIEKMINQIDENNLERDDEITKKLVSNEFTHSLEQTLELLDENYVRENFETLKCVLESIDLYEMKEIRTHLIDLNTNSIIANSERDKNFFCLKQNERVKFYFVEKCSILLDYYFYLAEVLLTSISEKIENARFLNENAQKRAHFIFLIIKFLTRSSAEYKYILSNYQFDSFSFKNN